MNIGKINLNKKYGDWLEQFQNLRRSLKVGIRNKLHVICLQRELKGLKLKHSTRINDWVLNLTKAWIKNNLLSLRFFI